MYGSPTCPSARTSPARASNHASRPVASGGISIVTGICLRDDDKLVAKKMSAYFPKRSYGVVMRRGKYLSGQARAFLDVAEQSSLPDSPWRIGHAER